MNTLRTETNYYPNGQVWVIKNFNAKNQLHGDYKRYNEEGKLELIINYKNGKIEGVWKEYFINGNISEEIHYTNNKKNGMSKKYSVNKSLISSIQYLNDREISNKLYSEMVFKNLYKFVYLTSDNDSRRGQDYNFPPQNNVYKTGSKFVLNNTQHFEIISGSISPNVFDFTFTKSKDFKAKQLYFDVDNVEYQLEKWYDNNINKTHGIGVYKNKLKPNGTIIKNFRNITSKKEKPIADENIVNYKGYNNNHIMFYKECKLYILADSVEELEKENETIKNI